MWLEGLMSGFMKYVVQTSFFPPECSVPITRMWCHIAGGDARAENLNGLKNVVSLERKVLHHLCYVV